MKVPRLLSFFEAEPFRKFHSLLLEGAYFSLPFLEDILPGPGLFSRFDDRDEAVLDDSRNGSPRA